MRLPVMIGALAAVLLMVQGCGDGGADAKVAEATAQLKALQGRDVKIAELEGKIEARMRERKELWEKFFDIDHESARLETGVRVTNSEIEAANRALAEEKHRGADLAAELKGVRDGQKQIDARISGLRKQNDDLVRALEMARLALNEAKKAAPDAGKARQDP